MFMPGSTRQAGCASCPAMRGRGRQPTSKPTAYQQKSISAAHHAGGAFCAAKKNARYGSATSTEKAKEEENMSIASVCCSLERVRRIFFFR
jgi:hypothetical protein